MENQMIENLLNDIFLKKDGKIKEKPVNSPVKAAVASSISRPNYQRNRSLHKQSKSNDDVDVFDLMREYMQ